MASRRASAAPGEPQQAVGVSQANPESFILPEEKQQLLDDTDYSAFLNFPADPLESLLQPVRDELQEVVEVPTTPAPGSAPTISTSAPIPASTVHAHTPAPVTHAPQASGTWSQPDNAAPLDMGPSDLFNGSDYFTNSVPAPYDNGTGVVGLGMNFNSNGLDATLSGPFNFLGGEGFDFRNNGFLSAANNLDVAASLQSVEGLQSNVSGVMTNLYGSGQNAYNGSSTTPGTYGFVQNGQNEFSAGLQNFGVGQNIMNEVPTMLQNYAAGNQVKNEVSPNANDFVFAQNDISAQPNDYFFVRNNGNQVSAQTRTNFGQSAHVNGHGTQAVPYTFSDSDHASQATPRSDGSNEFDYVHVEEAGPVNPVVPGNPSSHAGNLGQQDMDALYQQLMKSHGFQRAGTAPAIPAPASVPAPRRKAASTSASARRRSPASASVPALRRSRTSTSAPTSRRTSASRRSAASAQVPASAHLLPTATAPPALPAATAPMVPLPVVATNTSTGTTAPPVPAPIPNNANNVPLTAQNYVPLINDSIVPPNPNGPRPIYPAFSNHFATGAEAKAWRTQSRGMIKDQAPDLLRVKEFGRNYWVRRIYESIIDISNIDDSKQSCHRRRIKEELAYDTKDLEATAHHIFDRAIGVHEVGWNRLLLYHKEAKRGKLIDLGERCLERRLACICTALQQQKAVVDDALRGGITLRLLCDNPTARAATKKSNNAGNRKRGLKLKVLKKMGVKVPDVSEEQEEQEEQEPEESEEQEDLEGYEGYGDAE